ncbi:MAG: Lrp/AsnC family transcriptional regulator [Intrasporangium sp.]|uniref:Lrp/AsnC family transcriptional regulator n=1 Tax=Intrasporangium sp. TaxID=1925024 RepID=UPI0026495DED|nr:Lrp/AsnC family transcriptional regulator [Intrasporangium sp.]MDN5796488.1 Lrp/AsnC family transcriptional regulator [Intrasporangium sp.]
MPRERAVPPRIPRGPCAPPPAPPLDEIDLAVLALLVDDGRMPNAEIARRVGIPESTCAGRVRSLLASKVVRGIHAELDLASVGRPMEAMIALQFTGHARAGMDAVRARIGQVPGVIAAYHVAGHTDFLVHVCAASADELRNLVLDHLTSLAGVAHAETSLVFERIEGGHPWDPAAARRGGAAPRR